MCDSGASTATLKSMLGCKSRSTVSNKKSLLDKFDTMLPAWEQKYSKQSKLIDVMKANSMSTPTELAYIINRRNKKTKKFQRKKNQVILVTKNASHNNIFNFQFSKFFCGFFGP